MKTNLKSITPDPRPPTQNPSRPGRGVLRPAFGVPPSSGAGMCNWHYNDAKRSLPVIRSFLRPETTAPLKSQIQTGHQARTSTKNHPKMPNFALERARTHQNFLHTMGPTAHHPFLSAILSALALAAAEAQSATAEAQPNGLGISGQNHAPQRGAIGPQSVTKNHAKIRANAVKRTRT
jgi:hypothetical protein